MEGAVLKYPDLFNIVIFKVHADLVKMGKISMIESTALDFCRKSKKPEIESYIIDQDFRKIQLKILPLTGYCHRYLDQFDVFRFFWGEGDPQNSP